MALAVPICGEVRLLNMVLNTGSVNENPYLRLYTNSFDTANLNTLGITSLTDVTSSAGAYGSTAKLCAGSMWSVVSGTPSQASFAEQTFTFTASFGNVHGYYMVHSLTNILLFAEKFTGGPYNIVNSGDAIKVTPVLTLA